MTTYICVMFYNLNNKEKQENKDFCWMKIIGILNGCCIFGPSQVEQFIKQYTQMPIIT
jgi:hypothetical protein